MKKLLITLIAAALCARPALAAPPVLHVAGNELRDSAGRVALLRGVNIPSLEWMAAGDHVLESVGMAMDKWNANIVRLPLSQDRWFGKAPEQTDGGKAYRTLVDSLVRAAAVRNKYLLLDLHWSDAGQWGQHIGQHSLPDDNSALFWRAVASRYANVPSVLFDLYNEPRDITWAVWQNGGTVTEHNGDRKAGEELTYHSPGMQSLLDTVRATGAKNIVVAGGLDWAYDLSGIVSGHALRDPKGQGVMYATHIYPWKKDWETHVTPATKKYAVFVGEVGCQPAGPSSPEWQKVDCSVWAPTVLAYVNSHHLSMTAWSFHPSAGPSLITGFDYAPTQYWGTYVQTFLAKADNK